MGCLHGGKRGGGPLSGILARCICMKKVYNIAILAIVEKGRTRLFEHS